MRDPRPFFALSPQNACFAKQIEARHFFSFVSVSNTWSLEHVPHAVAMVSCSLRKLLFAETRLRLSMEGSYHDDMKRTFPQTSSVWDRKQNFSGPGKFRQQLL